MNAREKIVGLTNSYYGYAVFMAALSLWNNGIGFFSLLGTVGSFLFSIMLTWFIGRRLLAKSSLTRVILVVFTSIASVLGTVAVAKMGYSFIQSWSLSILVYAVVSAITVYMNAKAFRVLTDSSVKAYIGG